MSSFSKAGWWTKPDYYALVMHHVFASHSEVHAVFSDKLIAEQKCEEFTQECERRGIPVKWGVEPFDMTEHLGHLGHGQKFEEIAVVNTIPSVARFLFFPSGTEITKLVVDACEPLEQE